MPKRTITLVFIAALIKVPTFAEPKLIRQVKPVYPAEAAQAGIVGTVRLTAIVAPDGMVADVVCTLVGGGRSWCGRLSMQCGSGDTSPSRSRGSRWKCWWKS